jgi:Trk-type K+ transport system membrane component
MSLIRLLAIGHSFAALSTGGFSTHDDSVAHFDSMTISLILALFMFLGGANFGLHFMMFRNRSLGGYRRDSEFRAYTAIMLSLSAFVTVMARSSESRRRARLIGIFGCDADEHGSQDRQFRGVAVNCPS